MLIAVIATIFGPQVSGNYSLMIILILLGGSIGLVLSRRVKMTEMPELVALLHSFVGAAAVLVGFASDQSMGSSELHPASGLYASEVAIDIFIGAITFTGSVAAFAKLKASFKFPFVKETYLSLIHISEPTRR